MTNFYIMLYLPCNIKEQHVKYKLSTIQWFKINDSEFLPFIINNEKTKIKLLTENVVLPLKPVYSDDRISLAQVRRGKGLDNQCMYAVEDYLVDKRAFVVSDSEYIFTNYYLDRNILQRLAVLFRSNDDNDNIIKSKIYNELWLSESQIKKITKEINKNYKKVVEINYLKSGREERKREKAREKARKDREETEGRINETKNF